MFANQPPVFIISFYLPEIPAVTLKSGLGVRQGHWKSPFNRAHVTSY